MAKYRTAENRNTAEPQTDWKTEKINYQWEFKKDKRQLVEIGRTNIQEEISAYEESTNIESIIARAAAGDTEVLERMHGMYINTAAYPHSLMEAQNTIIRLENDFMHLPVEKRAIYNNDVKSFINDFGSENWLKNMGYEMPKKESEIKVEEKKENETE